MYNIRQQSRWTVHHFMSLQQNQCSLILPAPYYKRFPGPFITRSLLVVLSSSHPTAFPTPGHRLALLWRIFVPSRTESGALGEAWLDECLSKSRNRGAAVMRGTIELGCRPTTASLAYCSFLPPCPSEYGARPDNYVVYSMRKVPRWVSLSCCLSFSLET